MEKTSTIDDTFAENGLVAAPVANDIPLPRYLTQTYWWAYVHPRAIWVFERQWLVNLILWGNFARLREAALDDMGPVIEGRSLQVACVYGDFTPRLAQRLAPGATLDVIDVAPIQIENAQRKLGRVANVALHHQDSTALRFADGHFDQVVVFFLLHEQPASFRAHTIREALRVTREGGKVVFVDYHRPHRLNPIRYVMNPVLKLLEPYAHDLWDKEIIDWAPADCRPRRIAKTEYFGGLYQKTIMTR